ITDSEIVSPPPTVRMVVAMSMSPGCRSTNQATTASWPANIAAKTKRPHSVVPQNFQIFGGRAGASAGRLSVARGSINRLSRQCPFQQAPDVVIGKVCGPVHAAVIPGKPGIGEQFRAARRDRVKRRSSREQGQLLHRDPRDALAIGTAERLADGGHG